MTLVTQVGRYFAGSEQRPSRAQHAADAVLRASWHLLLVRAQAKLQPMGSARSRLLLLAPALLASCVGQGVGPSAEPLASPSAAPSASPIATSSLSTATLTAPPLATATPAPVQTATDVPSQPPSPRVCAAVDAQSIEEAASVDSPDADVTTEGMIDADGALTGYRLTVLTSSGGKLEAILPPESFVGKTRGALLVYGWISLPPDPRSTRSTSGHRATLSWRGSTTFCAPQRSIWRAERCTFTQSPVISGSISA